MSAARLFARLLARYGEPIAVTGADGTETTVRALIEPVRAVSRQAMAFTARGTGLIGPEQYVCLAPAACALDDAVSMRAGTASYLIRRAERICAGGEAVYFWGLLVRDGGETLCSS